MKKPGQTSPVRLACWDLIGGLLILTGFVQELVYVLFGSGEGMWLGPFVLGMGIIFIAERELRNEIWTDEELGPLRRLLDHPAWKLLIWIPFFVLLIMVSVRRLDHHRVLWVFLILPSQTVMRLQQIVKPKVSSEGLLALQSFAPIYSGALGWSAIGARRATALSLAMPSYMRQRCFVQPVEPVTYS